ncbi:hypothetical protein [Nocardioides soli]|uniref:O-antigen ligase domain-containing protein n=1 Tax=Nocardioides soli TaxID=1036020 RepID=A0A7W4VTE3_9ACTN|nr:hypothetical protein [Nocardioides soli]MBB3041039.1 hypothetical protein [Nocardioides soli]
MSISTTRQQPDLTDLRLLAAVVGLMFISVPAVNGVSPEGSDLVMAGAAITSLIPILSRASRIPRLSAAVFTLMSVYLIGTLLFSEDPTQGYRHTISTVAAGGTLLLFAAYGKEMLGYSLFRLGAFVLIVGGIVGSAGSGLPKNIVGGSIVYLLTLGALLLIVRKPHNAWFYTSAVFAMTGVLALRMDFRSMIGFTLILMLAYWGATALRPKVFWLVGLIGAVGTIWAITWYFLNAHANRLAIEISQRITAESGRRALSGRDWLWPYITRRVDQDGQWFGLGVGSLPGDFLPTDLSSHSFYMQTYLQLGVFGLALVAFVLLTVWKTVATSRQASGRFGAALFLMFVVHNSTEVLAFQNGLLASIPAWCAIGLAYSLTRAEVDAPKLEPKPEPEPEVSQPTWRARSGHWEAAAPRPRGRRVGSGR